MEEMQDKAGFHWLYQAVGVGKKMLWKELEKIGTARQIYDLLGQGALEKCLRETGTMSEEACRKYVRRMEAFTDGYDVPGEYDRMRKRGIYLVTREEKDYPAKLGKIPDAPRALYFAGKLPGEKKSVAIVGARECSEYGKYMAGQFGRQLAAAGVCIVSGMARGIDGISQEAALCEGGDSLAVLGCGVDVCYPESNRELYERLLVQGGICSEYPPGITPRAVLFPPRNRIISGLADAVLVVEAREKSGTLITVDMALEQGRDVYALPGRATDPLSVGCLRLIRQGAALVYTPQQLLEELAAEQTDGKVFEQQKLVFLEGELKKLYDILDFQNQSAQKLLNRYAEVYHEFLTLPELFQGMLRLCALGYAVQVGGMHFARKGG
jgi:DNA processing protein